MRTLRYPLACEQCFAALKGTVEIELKREAGDYYLDIRQTAKLDWGICPRCEKLVCFASCWSREQGFCKACAPFSSQTIAAAASAVAAVTAKQADYCPECRKTLTGAIEVKEIELLGVPVIALEETSDRNWIQCDACNVVVCKSCCLNPYIGYCNDCLKRLRKESESGKAADTYSAARSQTQTTEISMGGQIK